MTLGFCACLQDAFFLQGTDRLSAEYHGDLLAIDHESLLLQVWLEGSLGATQ